MGVADAKQDGVRFKGDFYTRFFYPPCQYCGAEVPCWNYLSDIKYTCQNCREKMKMNDRKRKSEELLPLKQKRLDSAIARMEAAYRKRCRKCPDLSGAILYVTLNLDKPGWFASTEEIMVALELYHQGIPFRHQVKFGRYRADFVLDDEKIVLEVDGRIFHTDVARPNEKMRDELIILGLGVEWEVLRFTDDLINKDISRLINAIRKTKRYRKDARAMNNGQLPRGFAKKTN